MSQKEDTMKKIINDPNNYLTEMLEGIYIACAIAPFSSVPFGYLYIKSGIWKRSLVKVKERED